MQTLEVTGKYALFTRPEFKVERLSYEVMTPSAARAIFEAVYWQPGVRWQIRTIEVLSPIQFALFRRCETAAMAHPAKTAILADRTRQLRSALVLRDVKYRVTAEMEFNGELLMVNDQLKHNAIFRRRAQKGQCFTQPYLGCREFAADWRLINGEWLMVNGELEPPIDETRNLGRMLLDIDHSDPKHPTPIYFEAKLIKGKLTIDTREPK